MSSEILAAGTIIMLLTAFLATGTSKLGFKRSKEKNSYDNIAMDPKRKKRKNLIFQFYWYVSLFFSMVICIVVSLREDVVLPLGSYDINGSGLIFAAALLTYAGSSLYLGN